MCCRRGRSSRKFWIFSTANDPSPRRSVAGGHGHGCEDSSCLVLIADNLDAPRSLLIHLFLSRDRIAEANWKFRSAIFPFWTLSPLPMFKASVHCHRCDSKGGSALCPRMI